MDQTSRAAFITAMAACSQAKLVSMQEQNASDRAAGRPITHQPYEFNDVPHEFGLGHNAVITYLMGG